MSSKKRLSIKQTKLNPALKVIFKTSVQTDRQTGKVAWDLEVGISVNIITLKSHFYLIIILLVNSKLTWSCQRDFACLWSYRHHYSGKGFQSKHWSPPHNVYHGNQAYNHTGSPAQRKKTVRINGKQWDFKMSISAIWARTHFHEAAKSKHNTFLSRLFFSFVWMQN